MEAHERSSVACTEALGELVLLAAHPFFRASWAPLPGLDHGALVAGLEALAPSLSLIHVRNWDSSFARNPLADDEDSWKELVGTFLAHCMKTDLDHWALLEYLEDDSERTLEREALSLALLIP
jgi:hypothetical protein